MNKDQAIEYMKGLHAGAVVARNEHAKIKAVIAISHGNYCTQCNKVIRVEKQIRRMKGNRYASYQHIECFASNPDLSI